MTPLRHCGPRRPRILGFKHHYCYLLVATAHLPFVPLATSRDRHGPAPLAADACRDGGGSPRSSDSDAVSAPRLAATRIDASGAVTARAESWSRHGHGVISRRGHGRCILGICTLRRDMAAANAVAA